MEELISVDNLTCKDIVILFRPLVEEKDVKFCSKHLLITYFDLFVLDWKSH